MPACVESLWLLLMCGVPAVQKRLAKEAKDHERLRKAAEKVIDFACWVVPRIPVPSVCHCDAGKQ